MKAPIKTIVLLLLALVPIIGRGQAANHINHERYRAAIKNFYHLLFTQDSMSVGEFEQVYGNASISYDSEFYYKDSILLKTTPRKKLKYHIDTSATSYVFRSMRKHLADITYKANEHKIDSIIDDAEIYGEGYEFSEAVELSFGKKKKIYFEVSVDSPYQILFVWLADGSLLEDILVRRKWPEKLLLAGTIDPLVGEAELRDRARVMSKVIGKLKSTERYYFIPGGFSDWWAVCIRDDMRSAIGYVHYSYIVKYPYVPPAIKKKVERERTMVN